MVKSSGLEAVGKTICPYGRGLSWGSTSDDRIVATCLVPRDGMTPEQADEIDVPRKAAKARISEELDKLHSAKERGDDDAAAAAGKTWREAALRLRKHPKSGWTGEHFSMDEIEGAWPRISSHQRPLPPLTEVRRAASIPRIAKAREEWYEQRRKYLKESGTNIGPFPGEKDTPDAAAELKRLIPLRVTEPAVATVGRTICPKGATGGWWRKDAAQRRHTKLPAWFRVMG